MIELTLNTDQLCSTGVGFEGSQVQTHKMSTDFYIDETT